MLADSDPVPTRPGKMSFLAWMAVTGGLLLSMALASSYLRNLPISTAALYLGVGLALGPAGFGVASLDLDSLDAAPLVEHVAEVAVIVALFVGGLKLRLAWHAPRWRTAYLLAGPVMLLTIAGVAAVVHLVLGLPLGTALLVGAVLAPTDPVLAGAVTVNDAADHDRVRYALSGEAGLNDGTAFPFVVFALSWAAHDGPGGWIGGWALHRLLWAVPAGLLLGFGVGLGLGWLAIVLRSRQRDVTAPSDILALALIALSYVGAESIGAWGFLAVFAAGLGLRSAELRVVAERPHPAAAWSAAPLIDGAVGHPPAEQLVPARTTPESLEEPAVAAGVVVGETLSFGATVERLLEVGLMLAVGVALVTHWDARAIPLALLLFFVIRPAAVWLWLLLPATTTSASQRWLLGWFGVRGIGSFYYLGYALTHGASGAMARDATSLTVSVVALSIVLHGASVQPLLAWYERYLARKQGPKSAA
jgi:sodium/hydrogen antiporter